jgi:ribosomal protein S3AE
LSQPEIEITPYKEKWKKKTWWPIKKNQMLKDN